MLRASSLEQEHSSIHSRNDNNSIEMLVSPPFVASFNFGRLWRCQGMFTLELTRAWIFITQMQMFTCPRTSLRHRGMGTESVHLKEKTEITFGFGSLLSILKNISP